jgi:hypothetical protein
MKRCLIFGLTIFLPLCWFGADATTYMPKPRSEILEKSVFIGVVHITNGRLVNVTYKGESKDCGYVYLADVEDGLLGEQESVEFFVERSLRIGHNHVIFLTEGDTAGQDMTSSNSMMWPAIQLASEIRKLCESRFSGLKAIRGLTSQFTSQRQLVADGEVTNEHWVEYSEFAYSDKNDIATYEFEAETIKIYSRGEKVVTISADDLLDDSINVQSQVYPYVWLNRVLMKWDDYRAAIVVELANSSEAANAK